jgi:DNA-binding transcriptional LysR family regulator
MNDVSLAQPRHVVDTYRHFVTADEQCFVTQPTLSRQIKKLEDEFRHRFI